MTREPVGILAGKAAQPGSGQRGAVARDAGDQGGRLSHSEPESIDGAGILMAASLRATVRQRHGQRADQQPGSDRRRRSQPRLDRAPQARGHEQAGAVDALWLGVAQACALIPGVSRNGATLAAARLRGFTREDANRLSRHVALPVIAGATLLKGVRLARRGVEPGMRLPFALGAASSFASTLGSTWLIKQVERDRSLLPYAAYRVALGAAVLARSGG